MMDARLRTPALTEAVMARVVAERGRQDAKFGLQNNSRDRWIVIEAEEFGEAARALCENDITAYEKEMIEVAAVAVAAVENSMRQRGVAE